MKIIVASMLKSGTQTMRKCLQILGYTVVDYDYHAFVDGDEWKKIMLHGSQKGQFYKMYKDVDVVCGSPAYYYWKEIKAEFPDAKVILTTRDEEEWLKSYENYFARMLSSWTDALTHNLTPTGRKVQDHCRRIGHLIFSCPPQRIFQRMVQPNRQIMKRRYREHVADVLANCEREKLLHFKFADGWEPLCSFLGEEIPKQPFPHENQKGGLAISMWQRDTYAALKTELIFVIAITLVIACFFVQLVIF